MEMKLKRREEKRREEEGVNRTDMTRHTSTFRFLCWYSRFQRSLRQGFYFSRVREVEGIVYSCIVCMRHGKGSSSSKSSSTYSMHCMYPVRQITRA